jgi:hypothetical protein
MATATAARAAPQQDGPVQFGQPVTRPIDEARMIACAHAIGEMQLVTLPDEMTIEEGPQDPLLWVNIAKRLSMHTWVQVTNDAGSFWRVMRVEKIHAGRGAGLRALVLRDVVPPRLVDLANEPIVSTGEWYVRHLGPHRGWVVVDPAGNVRREGIRTQREADNWCHQTSGNPRPQ